MAHDEYIHTHEHSHADGETHTHAHAHHDEGEHGHAHTHSGGEGHSHEHTHAGEAGRSHEAGHGSADKTKALLTYMIEHNEHHAEELAELMQALPPRAQKKLTAAIGTFEAANVELKEVLDCLD